MRQENTCERNVKIHKLNLGIFILKLFILDFSKKNMTYFGKNSKQYVWYHLHFMKQVG